MKRQRGKKIPAASNGPSEPKLSKQSQPVIGNAKNRDAMTQFWSNLQNRVNAIFEMQPITPEIYLDMYSSINDHCNNGVEKQSQGQQTVIGMVPGDTHFFAAEQIYTKLQHWIESYLTTLLNSNNEIMMMSGSDVQHQQELALNFYMKNWKNFSSSSHTLNNIFRYFNRFYVDPQKKTCCWGNGKKPYEVYDLALTVWKNTIFTALNNHVCNAVLNVIRDDRRGIKVNQDAVPSVVGSLIEMGVDKTTTIIPFDTYKLIETNPDLSVYVNEFECKLLDDTQAFYRDHANDFLRNYTPIQYIQSVEGILDKERNRVRDPDRHRRWYHPSTESKIVAVCQKVLIEDKLDVIYGQFRPLLELEESPESPKSSESSESPESQDSPKSPESLESSESPKSPDSPKSPESSESPDSSESPESQREAGLKRLYGLVHMLERPELVNDMVKHYHDNIVSIGRAGIEKKMKEIEAKGGQGAEVFVNVIRKLFHDNKRLVQDAFRGGHQFSCALYKAVKEILRENPTTTLPRIDGRPRPTKTVEYMARYCDLVLRNNRSDAELDKIFSDVVEFYQLLDDKDVFIKYLNLLTANRLTQFKSSSDDGESSLLEKLERNGKDSTNKLMRMFQDYKTSRELTVDFLKTRKTSFGYDFNVQIFCQAVWPLRIQNGFNFNMPSELQASLTAFENFYSAPNTAEVPEGHKSKYSGRKLTWLPAVCSGEIRYSPPEGSSKVTFQASAYQIGIMLLFETRDSMTLDEIMEVTGLGLDIVQQIIKFFLKLKLFRVFGETCVSENFDLTGTTVVELFKKYQDKKTRRDINFTLRVKVKDEEETMDKDVEQQRHYSLQALIVRIMKTKRGYCFYNDIVTEVMKESAKGGITFKPQPRAIQMAVGALITTEYLTRDPENYESISYLA